MHIIGRNWTKPIRCLCNSASARPNHTWKQFDISQLGVFRTVPLCNESDTREQKTYSATYSWYFLSYFFLPLLPLLSRAGYEPQFSAKSVIWLTNHAILSRCRINQETRIRLGCLPKGSQAPFTKPINFSGIHPRPLERLCWLFARFEQF